MCVCVWVGVLVGRGEDSSAFFVFHLTPPLGPSTTFIAKETTRRPPLALDARVECQ